MFNFRSYNPWLRFLAEPAENDLLGVRFNPEVPPSVQPHTFSLATPAYIFDDANWTPTDGDFGGAVGPSVEGGNPLDPFNGQGAAFTGPDVGLHTPNLASPPSAMDPSSFGWRPQDFGRQVRSDTFVPGFRAEPPDDPPGFRTSKSSLHSNALQDESGFWSFGYIPDADADAVLPPSSLARDAVPRTDSQVYPVILPRYDALFTEPPPDRIKQALDEIARIYGLDRKQATLPDIAGALTLRSKTQEFSQPIKAQRRPLREVEGKPLFANQSSRQPPLSENVVSPYASANGGQSEGRAQNDGVESVVPRYTDQVVRNDAIGRMDVPANSGIRGAVVASFDHTEPLAGTPYQTYGTSPALVTLFGHTGQPFDAEPGNTYYRTNNPLRFADLSRRNIERNENTQPSMTDAYPEPLISGAQYAQVVVQQNDAVLGNARIDDTTERLLSVLAETVRSLSPGAGPLFGIQAHVEFANRVRKLNIPGIHAEGVEQSFSVGDIVRYGLEGSVRTDVVLRDQFGAPIAVYDLKTGNARLSASRVKELRDAVGVPNIPVIELRYRSESAVLR